MRRLFSGLATIAVLSGCAYKPYYEYEQVPALLPSQSGAQTVIPAVPLTDETALENKKPQGVKGTPRSVTAPAPQ